jgi:hypothetical protein
MNNVFPQVDRVDGGPGERSRLPDSTMKTCEYLRRLTHASIPRANATQNALDWEPS